MPRYEQRFPSVNKPDLGYILYASEMALQLSVVYNLLKIV